MPRLADNVYFRLDPEARAKVAAIARDEGLKSSDIYRRALRLYLAGGHSAWLQAEREKAAAVPSFRTEVLAIAEYLARLPEDVTPLLADLILAVEKHLSPESEAIGRQSGKVRNILAAASRTGTGGSGAGRGRRRAKTDG